MKPIFAFLLSVSLFLGQPGQVHSQVPDRRHTVQIGSQIPLQYNVGYQYQWSKRVSVRVQAGLLTKPYDAIILRVVELFGTDPQLIPLIQASFRVGGIGGIGVHYHAKKSYAGVYGHYIALKGAATPAEALSAYFGKDFSAFGSRGESSALELVMQSNLYDAGILYGRKFALSNPRWEIATELAFGKTLNSRTHFESNHPRADQTKAVQDLYDELDEELRFIYWQYAFVPTLNLYLTHRF